MTIHQLLETAKRQLASLTDNPSLEAEILLAHALKKSRSYLYAAPEKIISATEAANFADYLKRRCLKEPIAYITGTREFWSLELKVNSETLIPRPETELLVEIVLDLSPTEKCNVADLGTGSGAIALALSHERPAWNIWATDSSEKTLKVAKQNARYLGLNNITFQQGDWCQALLEANIPFDVLVSNPPYIAENEWAQYATELAFEPRQALTAGKDGLEAIRVISQEAKSYLKRGGHIVLEHGFSQAAAVREILLADGYTHVISLRDLSGHERATLGQYC